MRKILCAAFIAAMTMMTASAGAMSPPKQLAVQTVSKSERQDGFAPVAAAEARIGVLAIAGSPAAENLVKAKYVIAPRAKSGLGLRLAAVGSDQTLAPRWRWT